MSEKAGTKEGGMVQDVAAIRALLEELVWDEEGGDGEWRAISSSNSPLQSHPPIKRDPGPKFLVLVMHHTGAVPGTQTAVNLTRTHRLKDGKKGGIISMVFINGIFGGKGETLEKMVKDLGEPALPKYAKVDVRSSILRTKFRYYPLSNKV